MNEAELLEAISTPNVRASDGELVPRHSGILPAYALALHRLVASRQPVAALEVGMAQGVSSVAILSALGEGKLTSVDPNQATEFRGVGLEEVRRHGFEHRHRWIGDYDYLALPDLVRAGERFDFAYVDGWHTFDYTLLDMFYVDKLLDVGGVVGLNDCGWAAVDTAIRAFLAHRDYREITVNEPTFAPSARGNGRVMPPGAGRVTKAMPPVAKRLMGRAFPGRVVRREDRYFEKVSTTEPNWDFFQFF